MRCLSCCSHLGITRQRTNRLRTVEQDGGKLDSQSYCQATELPTSESLCIWDNKVALLVQLDPLCFGFAVICNWKNSDWCTLQAMIGLTNLGTEVYRYLCYFIESSEFPEKQIIRIQMVKQSCRCHSNSTIIFVYLIYSKFDFCVYSAMNFNTWIDLCSHRHYQGIEQFNHLIKRHHAIALKSGPLPTNYWSVLHYYAYILSKMSYKQKHAVCNILISSSFTQCNAFETHPSYAGSLLFIAE